MNKEFLKIIKNSLIWIGIMFFLGLFAGAKAMYIGHTLGGLVSVVQAFMLYFDVEKTVNFGIYSKKFTIASYSKRYILSAIVMTAMILIDMHYFAFAIIGLHTIKIMVIIPYYFNKLKTKLEKLNEKYDTGRR